MRRRLGIYGGSFNPVHLGHIGAARAFLDSGLIDELLVMPAGIPPHKRLDPEDDPERRLRMTELAFAEFPEFGKSLFVSDYEIRNQGKSYTVLTLRHFSSYSDDITLLCGTDMLLCLDSWYMPEEIFKRAKIVCARRENDSGISRRLKSKADEYKRLFGADIGFLDIPALEMSSSEIRKIISDGGDASRYLTSKVAGYISDMGLYRKNVMKTDISTLEKFRDYAKEHLGERRFAHTLAVEEEAAALCRIFCPDKENELRCAALLHDITKELDTEKQLQLCAKYGILASDVMKASPKCFHALTGAVVAGDVFGGLVTDDMLTAIRYHTTGRENMTLAEKIIYLADYIEPTRTFADCVALRDFFYSGLRKGKDPEKHLDDTLILSFDLLIKDLLDDGAPIMPDTVSARNYLCIARK